MNFLSQPDMVRASLNLAPTPAERHGTYTNRSISRTGDHPRPTDEGRVSAVPSRTTPSHGARPEESGAVARWAGHPTHSDALTAECGHCLLLPDTDPMTGQYDLIEAASCPVHGWGEHPVMRRVPGTTRHV